MAKLTKNQKAAAAKIEASKFYSLTEASALVKEISNTKFVYFFKLLKTS